MESYSLFLVLTFQSYQTRGIRPDLVKLGEANTKGLTGFDEGVEFGRER